ISSDSKFASSRNHDMAFLNLSFPASAVSSKTEVKILHCHSALSLHPIGATVYCRNPRGITIVVIQRQNFAKGTWWYESEKSNAQVYAHFANFCITLSVGSSGQTKGMILWLIGAKLKTMRHKPSLFGTRIGVAHVELVLGSSLPAADISSSYLFNTFSCSGVHLLTFVRGS